MDTAGASEVKRPGPDRADALPNLRLSERTASLCQHLYATLDIMDEPRDGLTIARQRIAEEAKRRTGSLDLNNLGLATLPDELFALSHLQQLDLGGVDPWTGGINKRAQT
jgi:hypothetical protein